MIVSYIGKSQQHNEFHHNQLGVKKVMYDNI